MTVATSGEGKSSGVAAKLDTPSPWGMDCSGCLV